MKDTVPQQNFLYKTHKYLLGLHVELEVRVVTDSERPSQL